MDKKTLDILSGAKDRIKEVVGLMENIELIRNGIDDSGATHYTSYGALQLDIDRCNIALKGVIESLADAIEEQKAIDIPEKPYKEQVFDLISSRPIPGVESIEVNESQRKFVVKYKYDEPPEDTTNHEPTWTLSELRKEIAALEAYNSSGGSFGRPLSLLEFLMSEHYIIWSVDGKPYSVKVAVDKNGNPKTKE